MKHPKDHTSKNEPSSPKLGRRLSLSGLFRSKSSRQAPSVSDFSQSSTSVNVEGSIASENTLERKPSKKKVVADIMSKIFKRKSTYLPLASEETGGRTHRVSSYYIPAQETAEEASTTKLERPNQSLLMQRKSVMETRRNVSFQEELHSATKEICPDAPSRSITELFAPSKGPERPIQIRTTTRCALLLSEQLNQGTMTITTRDIHFQASAFPTRLNFRVNYSEIVAFLPISYYGAKGVQVATLQQCLKFVNIPERDDVTSLLMKEWIIYCRLMLVRCGTIKRARDTAPVPMATVLLPCGCSRHYKTEMARKQIPALPMPLAGFLFGGGLHGVKESFMTTLMHSVYGIEISSAQFHHNENSNRHRVLTVTFPEPTGPLHFRNEQTIIRETADLVVIECTLRPAHMGPRDPIEFKLCWCIRRDGLFTGTSTVVLTGETNMAEQGEQDVLMIKALRERALEHFTELLNAVYLRMATPDTVAESLSTNVELSSIRRTSLFLKQVWLFLILPKLRWLRFRQDELRRISLIALILVIILLVSGMFTRRSYKVLPSEHLIFGEYQRSAAKNINNELQDTRSCLASVQTKLAVLERDLYNQ